MGKYFGTDGIRGVYGTTLDINLAFRTGLAIARHFGKGEYVIVRDSRESGPAIEDAVIKGLYAGGGQVLAGGILPTPAAAYLVKEHGARAGIVISASHNPPEYNGIKVFDFAGRKIDETTETAIETIIDFGGEPQPDSLGTYKILSDAKEQYITYLTAQTNAKLGGLKVYLDCCFGATAGLAKEVFERLGATVCAFNDTFDGTRINGGCGAVHPEFLMEKMGEPKENEIGFSFDGDGDRLSVVREGVCIDGDTILFNLASSMELSEKTVVGTILSNLALEENLAAAGCKFYRTPVGDKYIANMLFSKGFSLGGEQSGHFIINKHGLTGDAILTALYLLSFLYSGGTLRPHLKLSLYPQIQMSRPADKSILADSGFQNLVKENERLLAGGGRIIARMSGTEPIVRIMVEGRNAAEVEKIIRSFEEFFR